MKEHHRSYSNLPPQIAVPGGTAEGSVGDGRHKRNQLTRDFRYTEEVALGLLLAQQNTEDTPSKAPAEVSSGPERSDAQFLFWQESLSLLGAEKQKNPATEQQIATALYHHMVGRFVSSDQPAERSYTQRFKLLNEVLVFLGSPQSAMFKPRLHALAENDKSRRHFQLMEMFIRLYNRYITSESLYNLTLQLDAAEDKNFAKRRVAPFFQRPRTKNEEEEGIPLPTLETLLTKELDDSLFILLDELLSKLEQSALHQATDNDPTKVWFQTMSFTLYCVGIIKDDLTLYQEGNEPKRAYASVLIGRLEKLANFIESTIGLPALATRTEEVLQVLKNPQRAQELATFQKRLLSVS